MSIRIIPYVVVVLLVLVVDLKIWQHLRRSRLPRAVAWAHAAVALLLLVCAVVSMCLPPRTVSNAVLRVQMWLIYAYFAFTAPKVLGFALWALSWPHRVGRRLKVAIRAVAVAVAVAVFVLMVQGVVNARRVRVNPVTISFKTLPSDFDGYRIVQISDLHLLTYGTDTSFVSRCVDSINALHPDLIVFTGDMMSRRSDEVDPFVPVLARLHATDGVHAIYGNHDNGQYYAWPDSAARYADVDRLTRLVRQMGWDFMVNEVDTLRRGGSRIMLIGANDMVRAPYPQVYGRMERYYKNPNDGEFKIALTHNPDGWFYHYGARYNVPLTLVGHTHAMQMMFTIAGHDFSPARVEFKYWHGLNAHPRTGRLCYVNIGLGCVGMPARLGTSTPEVTLITLKKQR